ncbi:hypothetical protein CC1G_14681 [Coprinopsis cinerea okayama7|uniref:Uncharacterized protein n=1 Tax=Coprinopsis cinerea (strain Okayama-7 / 130 / ATCC MYA-4618 / FGSC 9003) TaxID=240176 RepID=D6RMZ6_COPC7|nr:hypothetical protein CC1G_14681 [Coprinopsis cinerea okayama7\|eukprot:XP_002911252.1 hypothetical protein CC1G_14681 [Coprinopsis cinerea okayama7\
MNKAPLVDLAKDLKLDPDGTVPQLRARLKSYLDANQDKLQLDPRYQGLYAHGPSKSKAAVKTSTDKQAEDAAAAATGDIGVGPGKSNAQTKLLNQGFTTDPAPQFTPLNSGNKKPAALAVEEEEEGEEEDNSNGIEGNSSPAPPDFPAQPANTGVGKKDTGDKAETPEGSKILSELLVILRPTQPASGSGIAREILLEDITIYVWKSDTGEESYYIFLTEVFAALFKMPDQAIGTPIKDPNGRIFRAGLSGNSAARYKIGSIDEIRTAPGGIPGTLAQRASNKYNVIKTPDGTYSCELYSEALDHPPPAIPLYEARQRYEARRNARLDSKPTQKVEKERIMVNDDDPLFSAFIRERFNVDYVATKAMTAKDALERTKAAQRLIEALNETGWKDSQGRFNVPDTEANEYMRGKSFLQRTALEAISIKHSIHGSDQKLFSLGNINRAVDAKAWVQGAKTRYQAVFDQISKADFEFYVNFVNGRCNSDKVTSKWKVLKQFRTVDEEYEDDGLRLDTPSIDKLDKKYYSDRSFLPKARKRRAEDFQESSEGELSDRLRGKGKGKRRAVDSDDLDN